MTPRKARVYLGWDTWHNHIITFHSVLEGCELEVLNTIEHPELIYFDKYRNTFFNFMHSEEKGMWIVVVYTVHGKTGRVKTAYVGKNPYSQAVPYPKVWSINMVDRYRERVK